MFKKFFTLVIALLFVLGCATSIQATGKTDAFITLTASSSKASLYELPLPPNTRKSLTGTYVTKDALGVYNSQGYSGSIATGQLNVMSYAPNHFVSYRSYFSYRLNGVLQPDMINAYY